MLKMSEELLPPSKSEIKRQLKTIKKLAINLSQLQPGQLKQLPLSEAVFDTVLALQQINSNVAKKRQTQYLTKQLANQENLASIEQAYLALKGQKEQLNADFHLAERWRERLLDETRTALTQFIEIYPSAATQQLRHLIQKAHKEQCMDVNHGAYRALFRFIKQVIDNE